MKDFVLTADDVEGEIELYFRVVDILNLNKVDTDHFKTYTSDQIIIKSMFGTTFSNFIKFCCLFDKDFAFDKYQSYHRDLVQSTVVPYCHWLIEKVVDNEYEFIGVLSLHLEDQSQLLVGASIAYNLGIGLLSPFIGQHLGRIFCKDVIRKLTNMDEFRECPIVIRTGLANEAVKKLIHHSGLCHMLHYLGIYKKSLIWPISINSDCYLLTPDPF